MDDLLGLNEIEVNNNSSCYFEEEDKKEELYIKMIEDRIMFKIKKEIIEPLISDFNVKTDINMCEILKLKDNISELKECVEREKNKNIELSEEIDRLNYNYRMVKNEKNELKEYLTNIQNDMVPIGIYLTNIQNDMVRMEDNLGQIDELNEKLVNMEHNIKDNIKDNAIEINKILNIISKLRVYAPTSGYNNCISYSNDSNSLYPIGCGDFHYIATKKFTVNNFTGYSLLDLKIFYNLETLHLTEVHKVDFQNIYNDYLNLTTLIFEKGGYQIHDGKRELTILNLNYLPSLKVIEFKQINNIDVDTFTEELSSYNHKIQNIICTDCEFVRNRFSNEIPFIKLKSYCDENDIKLEIQSVGFSY